MTDILNYLKNYLTHSYTFKNFNKKVILIITIKSREQTKMLHIFEKNGARNLIRNIKSI